MIIVMVRRSAMTTTSRYTNYLTLLKIRHSARKRDATFMGVVFFYLNPRYGDDRPGEWTG
jgi:hypothetical protein